MRKFQFLLALVMMAFIPAKVSAQAAPPTINLSPAGTQFVCSTGKDTFYYSLAANNIPANTNIVIYQGTDSLFNPYQGQGDSIGFVPGQAIPKDTFNFGACVKILGIFIDACGPAGQEGRNEYIVLTSGNGFAVNNLGIDYSAQNNTSGAPNNDLNINTNPCGYKTPAAGLIANLRSGSCNASNVIPVGPGGNVPANAIVVVFTSDSVNAPYSLNGLCNTGYTIYVLQSACIRTIGAFTNAPRCDAPSRYRTTRAVVAGGNCSSSFTYDLCGIYNLDGTYAIRQPGLDTASVANNGIRRNTVDSCGGIDYTKFSFSSDTLLKYPLQNLHVACNVLYYLKAITHPNGTSPVSNAIPFKLICNSVEAISSTTNICSGDSVKISIGTTDPNATLSWTTSGGAGITGASVGSGNSIKQVLINSGNTKDSITYIATSSDAGCIKTQNVKVVVKPKPQPAVTGTLTFCSGGQTTLTANGQFDSVRWSTNQTSTSINVSQAGNYNVTVYKNGCSGNAGAQVAQTNCNIDTLYICEGDTVLLNGPGGYSNYSWTPSGTLNNSTIEDPLAFPTTTTKYIVQSNDSVNILTNGDFETGLQNWSTDYALFTNQNPPFGTYSIDSSAQHIYFGYCANPDVTANGKKYLIVDGSTSSSSRILYRTIAVQQNTDYIFEMWAMPISSHANVATFDVKFNSAVLINDLKLDTTTCLWKKYTYNWNSGASSSLNLEIIDVKATGQGNDFAMDDIALRKKDIQKDSVVVVVHPKPVPDISGNLSICNGSQTTLTVVGQFDSVRWNTNQTTTSINVNQGGNYSVTAYSGSCSGSASAIVTQMSCNSDTIYVCQGDSVKLTGPSGYQSYQWSPSTGLSSSTVQSPNAAPSSPTKYVVIASNNPDTTELVVNGNFESGATGFSSEYNNFYTPPCSGTCQHGYYALNQLGWCNNTNHTPGGNTQFVTDAIDSIQKRIWYETFSVHPNTTYTFSAWAFDFNPNPGILHLTVNNDIAVDSFTLQNNCSSAWEHVYGNWNSGNNTSATLAIRSYRGTIFGNDFSLDDISFKGITTATVKDSTVVIVIPKPTPVIDGNLSICNGGQTTLTAVGRFDSVRWNTNATTLSINVTQAGTYSVTAYSNGCSGTASVQVTSSSVPVQISGDLNICANSTTDLSVTGQFDSVRWSTNETTLLITVSQPGQYSVAVYSNGCSGTDAVTVNLQEPPAAFDLGNDTSYCGPFVRVLSTGDQATVWNTSVTAAQITVSLPGTYIAAITNSCGTVSDTINLEQNNLPVVDLGDDTTICEGQIELRVPDIFRSYVWSTGSQSPFITVTTPGIYKITVTDGNGCSNSDSMEIDLDCANTIFIPNAFTPNDDHVNDVFYVRGNPRNLSIQKMIIFDRWGEKIFEANDILPDDPLQGWNGMYKSKQVVAEVYSYLIMAKYANGEEVKYKGNVTVLK